VTAGAGTTALIDTHCHLDVAAFDADRDAVVARATGAGVAGILIPAIRPRTWNVVRALAHRHAAAGVRCALGIHPQIVPELAPDELAGDLTARLIDAARDATAIGECGLDGGTGAHALQEQIFRAHVRAAREANKPLVIHVLRAHDAAPRILREEGPIAAARAIPAELLLVETDAPDQAPEAHRGGRSEPAFVTQVIAGLAAARGTTAAEIAALTTTNACRIFGAW